MNQPAKTNLPKLSEIESGSKYNLIKASLLQKLIRRGMSEEANYVGKLFLDQNQEKGLRRRLQIIAAEDIGLGWVESINFVNTHNNLIEIIEALCQAPKNRESDRFLLTVANNLNSINIKRGKDIVHEARVLLRLFELSTTWFNDKTKENLNNLKNAFSKMAEDSKVPETIIALGDNYIELTKHKIHGARCQMALATLIYCRKVDKTNFVPDFSQIKITPFDEIFDFAIDMHTPIGKEWGRDFNHWIKNCVVVNPEYFYKELLDDQGNEKYPLTILSAKKN